MPTPAAPVRLPLDCDPFDLDAVRDWLLQHLDQVIPLEGQPPPAIHIFCDGHREVLALSPLAVQSGFDLPATWAAIRSRKDVEHALLVARFELEEGGTLAVVMGVEPDDEGAITSWWACMRGYDMTPEGIGTLTDPWHGVCGDGLPRDPFAMFTTPAPGATAWPLLPAKPPMPDIRAHFAELPEGARLPTTAQEMTEFVASFTMPQIERRGLDHARIVRLRGRHFEIWEVRGDHLPSSLDDFVRYVCQRETQADAVGIVAGTVFEEDGQRLHAVEIKAELGGRRAERVFTFHLPEGAEREVPSKTHWRDLGEVREGAGWIGVDPLVSWEIGVIGGVE